MTEKQFAEASYRCILDLTTEDGINASSLKEIYGCIFGRDSAITILKILKILKENKNIKFLDQTVLLDICRRTLLTLIALQGKEKRIESGEEPGKFIHEYRKEAAPHLLSWTPPWYIYPDGKIRNYDSIDSTPLVLIAIYKFWQLTSDQKFLDEALFAVEKGLEWIQTFADIDKDGLIEYEFAKDRVHGGLLVQNWADSPESVQKKDKTMPIYPIAPVEAQGFAWLALRLWADFFKGHNRKLSKKLLNHAKKMRRQFNKKFIFKDKGLHFCAQALEGDKKKIKTVTGNSLMLLWASYKEGGKIEAIVDKRYVRDLVRRSFKKDLFDPHSGIRTMSTGSPTYNPQRGSYHNGSFWPMLNGTIQEGLVLWGFKKEAEKLKKATLEPLLHFGFPIELYVTDEKGNWLEFVTENGQTGCRQQAWSAAVALDLLTL